MLFRRVTGKNLDDVLAIPTLQGVVAKATSDLASRLGPTRLLGYDAQMMPVVLSEEEREAHIHILGAPGEGKSKFIELLVRGDIERGYGACLLDPSENGDTANKILKYCASIGFKKVCYINPVDFLEFSRVPVIQPFKYKAPPEVSVGNLMDALKVLWATKDFSETPRIQRYVSAVLHALLAAGLTLPESKYFLSRQFVWQREHILRSLPADNNHRFNLDQAYTDRFTFEAFQSSVNRMNVFQDSTIQMMLGSQKIAIPWSTMISKGWLVLVNLDPQSVWGTEQIQQRLLGTLIINEIVHSIHRLQSKGWKGVYYLYIDEVGDYATSKLAYILDKKRKTGLRFTFAHQRFEQIEDRGVQSSIRGSAKTKVLFYTPNVQDRQLMMKDMGYGGSLPDRSVSYELGQTAKQSAAISIGKRNPRITRLVDVPDIQVSGKALAEFKKELYSYEWFHHPKEINQEINARFARPASTASINPTNQPGGYDAGRPARTRKTAVRRAAKIDSGASRQPRPTAAKRRPVKTVFSEE